MPVNIHEKTADKKPVPESLFYVGNRESNQGNRFRSVGKWGESETLLTDVRDQQRRGFTSSKTSVERTPKPDVTNRIQTSNGDTSRSPSLSSENLGGSSEKKYRENRKMKIVASANQKGGVGKTNCVVHLAYDFAERGLKVMVLDLDPQGNASYSLSKYKSAVPASQFFSSDQISLTPNEDITLVYGDAKMLDIEKLNIADVGKHLKTNLQHVSGLFDVCLIDTAPTLGIRLTAALYTANYVFTPIEVEAYSMLGVGMMKKTILNMSKLNPGLVNIGLIPSRMDKRNPLHVKNYKSLQAGNAKELAPLVIGQRASFGEALHNKIPVWQIKKTAARKAAKEMRAFAQFVITKMELK